MKYHAKMNDESFRMYVDLLGLKLVRTKRVQAPLLVLGAKEDSVISNHDVEKTAKAYNTKAEIFSNMAHDMMLEKGWKGVAERIMEWLTEKEIR